MWWVLTKVDWFFPPVFMLKFCTSSISAWYVSNLPFTYRSAGNLWSTLPFQLDKFLQKKINRTSILLFYIALCRERDELLALMHVLDRSRYESLRPSSVHSDPFDGFTSSEVGALFLLTCHFFIMRVTNYFMMNLNLYFLMTYVFTIM